MKLRQIRQSQFDKLTVTVKLQINDVILLLSSTDGPLLWYMHVYRIRLNVQERFVSGILYMCLAIAFNYIYEQNVLILHLSSSFVLH